MKKKIKITYAHIFFYFSNKINLTIKHDKTNQQKIMKQWYKLQLCCILGDSVVKTFNCQAHKLCGLPIINSLGHNLEGEKKAPFQVPHRVKVGAGVEMNADIESVG